MLLTQRRKRTPAVVGVVGRGTDRARQSALAASVGMVYYMLHEGLNVFVGNFFPPDVSGQHVVHGRQ